jgi:hypothetical protein
MPSNDEYLAEIKRLAEVAQKWVADNPDKSVQIAWRAHLGIIGVMGDAIKMGLVSVNDDGMELLKAMGCFEPGDNEPSIIMVRVALDAAMAVEK